MHSTLMMLARRMPGALILIKLLCRDFRGGLMPINAEGPAAVDHESSTEWR